MPILPLPGGFTFRPACPTLKMSSAAVSISIATFGGRLPRRPVSALRVLQLIPGSLCSRHSESRSSRYSASASRRRTCARVFSIICKKKPNLSFPTFTLFAILPISSRECLHSSGRFFCIFGIATASDDVRFAQATAWSQLSLRCTIRPDSLGLRSMSCVVVSIYLAAVVFCVGTTAWILRAWTRRRYWHKSPSDLHYVVAGTALLLSAGIGVAVASQIVVALGYPPAP